MILPEIEATLAIEGGYVDNPNDRGGATKYGISQRSYPNLDITNLTREEAAAILKRDFYDPLRLSEVKNDSVRWKIFDMAVNMGRLRAALYVQRAIGVSVDGIFGEETLTALNTLSSHLILSKLVETCVLHYTRIVERDVTQAGFIGGWMRRALRKDIA